LYYFHNNILFKTIIFLVIVGKFSLTPMFTNNYHFTLAFLNKILLFK